jgi:SpoVK/Ycf46/Vps4 family AAA+-type ATPase
MLIDGIPGLGKTKFADYATDTKLAGYVYKTDMTSFLQIEFSQVVKPMFHDIHITAPTIFLIDEVDKYLDYRLDSVINDVPVDDKVTKDPVAIKKQFKETFLYDMLSILERMVSSIQLLSYSVLITSRVYLKVLT